MGTSVERASAVSEMRQKAEGYRIPSNCVDGMELFEVREAALKALQYVREGKGPFFLEVETYRFRGHSMGDPERYRQAEEVKKWQENDPIGIYRRRLIADGAATEAELDALDDRAEADTAEAVQFAENSPEPPPEALWENIYADKE
jgi:pyruvate dehydrogenase E1 component alpha subunit